MKGLGIIDDFMASDDLNECVDALLQKKSKLTQNMNSAKKQSKKEAVLKSKTSTGGEVDSETNVDA